MILALIADEPVSWEMLTIIASVGFSAASTAAIVSSYLSRMREKFGLDIATLKLSTETLRVKYEQAHGDLVRRVERLEEYRVTQGERRHGPSVEINQQSNE